MWKQLLGSSLVPSVEELPRWEADERVIAARAAVGAAEDERAALEKEVRQQYADAVADMDGMDGVRQPAFGDPYWATLRRYRRSEKDLQRLELELRTVERVVKEELAPMVRGMTRDKLREVQEAMALLRERVGSYEGFCEEVHEKTGCRPPSLAFGAVSLNTRDLGTWFRGWLCFSGLPQD